MKKTELHNKIVSLVLPIAFSQFMLTLVSACDALMLGKLAQNAMPAVSLAGQVAFVLSLFTAALTIGGSMFAAQYWGKKDIDAVERIFALTLRVSVGVGLLFTVISFVNPYIFMKILTNEEELVELGAGYLRSVSLSYVLCSISQIYLCIMKNSGQARLSTLISSLAVILNIVLNAVLIFGLFGCPALGISGAAYATVIARAMEYGMVKINAQRSESIHLRLHWLLKPDKALQKTVWKHTLPVLGNELVWGLGFSVSAVMIGHLGTDAVAANSIASIVRNLIACFCIGLGSGGGILVGNALGAGRLEDGKILGRQITILALGSGILSGIISILLIPIALSVITLSSGAEHDLVWMLGISSIWMVGKSVNCATVGGIFCAGGDSRFGLLCDTVTLWGIIVPLGMLAAFVLKLPVLVVYFIVNMDELIKLPAVFCHYKKYKWVKDLTRLGECV